MDVSNSRKQPTIATICSNIYGSVVINNYNIPSCVAVGYDLMIG